MISAASLRENELDEDYRSRQSKPVTCIRNLPMLKTAAESYTRSLYSEFEEQFKQQFSAKCQLVSTAGTVKTYMVSPMKYEYEALVVFNSEDVTISCSCRRFESIGTKKHFGILVVYIIVVIKSVLKYELWIGILCKHALRVLNINEVFTLPSQCILHRWTKYAKRGFSTKTIKSEKESLQTRAARIARKATSTAMKCSVSEELLTKLEEAIDKLDLEADDLLSEKRHAKHENIPQNTNEHASNNIPQNTQDISTGKISFKVPEAIKGPKGKRLKGPLEKAKPKKSKTTQKKGTTTTFILTFDLWFLNRH